eukprot:1158382-Pelagomonas_calceolata.AAC.7
MQQMSKQQTRVLMRVETLMVRLFTRIGAFEKHESKQVHVSVWDEPTSIARRGNQIKDAGWHVSA